MPKYTIGLDYGTGSVRAILVSTSRRGNCRQRFRLSARHGGRVISDRDPNLARQHPRDYEAGAEATIKAVLKEGREKKGVRPEEVIGIGVDTTGSTPLPVDAAGYAAGLRSSDFENDRECPGLAVERSHFARRGGANQPGRRQAAAGISGENRQSVFLRMVLGENSALRQSGAGRVRRGGKLGGNCRLDSRHALRTRYRAGEAPRACVCAAGHKAFFNKSWGGYPDVEFLKRS